MNMVIAISKKKDRIVKLIKKMKCLIKNIVCLVDLYRGKTYSDLTNIALKDEKEIKKIVYIGDMKVDYLLSKNTKI